MENKFAIAAALLATLVGFSGHAQSAWNFSFTNSFGSYVHGNFTLNGSSGANLTATNLYITSYSGITILEDSSYNWVEVSGGNTFTVTGGNISFVQFSAYDGGPGYVNLDTETLSANYLYSDPDRVFAASPVVYTAIAPAPEPSTLALAALGAGALLKLRRRK